jgi:hypothetical protein
VEKDYYRIELAGNKVWLTDDEVHAVRWIFCCISTKMSGSPLTFSWLTVSSTFLTGSTYPSSTRKNGAESEGYKKLVEEGFASFAQRHGTRILDDHQYHQERWQNATAAEIILYLRQYQPRTDQLQIAKAYL